MRRSAAAASPAAATIRSTAACWTAAKWRVDQLFQLSATRWRRARRPRTASRRTSAAWESGAACGSAHCTSFAFASDSSARKACRSAGAVSASAGRHTGSRSATSRSASTTSIAPSCKNAAAPLPLLRPCLPDARAASRAQEPFSSACAACRFSRWRRCAVWIAHAAWSVRTLTCHWLGSATRRAFAPSSVSGGTRRRMRSQLSGSAQTVPSECVYAPWNFFSRLPSSPCSDISSPVRVWMQSTAGASHGIQYTLPSRPRTPPCHLFLPGGSPPSTRTRRSDGVTLSTYGLSLGIAHTLPSRSATPPPQR